MLLLYYFWHIQISTGICVSPTSLNLKPRVVHLLANILQFALLTLTRTSGFARWRLTGSVRNCSHISRVTGYLGMSTSGIQISRRSMGSGANISNDCEHNHIASINNFAHFSFFFFMSDTSTSSKSNPTRVILAAPNSFARYTHRSPSVKPPKL